MAGRRTVALALAALAFVAPACAAFLPPDLFAIKAEPGAGEVAVEADLLTYDAARDIITAAGDARLAYQGYKVRADRLEYHQKTGRLFAVGQAVILDPDGNKFEGDRFEVIDGMKETFVSSLTLTTDAGARITAREGHYSRELESVLSDASYTPCGTCVDAKGRKIGWKVKATRFIRDRANATVLMEAPTLEILGVPVAWLPWMQAPDPSQPRARGFRLPSFGYSKTQGAHVTLPFFVPIGADIDLVLSPTLMSRQGALMRADVTWRLPERQGEATFGASGIYQLGKDAYVDTVGFRDWRGAIQTTGSFTPTARWSAGWSYAAFTDNAYLKDYHGVAADDWTNEVFATHLSASTWLDARVQGFVRLGNILKSDDAAQGANLPLLRFAHIHDLAGGRGRLRAEGSLRGLSRAADQAGQLRGAPYTYGLAGHKAHAVLEAGWEKQFILPGGVTATPFLGGRLDFAATDATVTSTLFAATPIAALDVRWPLIAKGLGGAHLFEPVAQIVYRGTDLSAVGLANDDAHSFRFDTSNLFSYNRFSGYDRQETGLRANVGAHYLGIFENGGWLDVVIGQSFHLAGTNALGAGEIAQAGLATGLGGPFSHIVAGARGGVGGLTGAANIEVDPSARRATRGTLGLDLALVPWFSVGADYAYVAADPPLGIAGPGHEITGRARLTLADYWTLTAGLTWDLVANRWVKANAGIGYDDGYVAVRGGVKIEPEKWGASLGLTLKGPDNNTALVSYGE